jgi:hypothetical protein
MTKGMTVSLLVDARIAAGLVVATALLGACANSQPADVSVSAPVSSRPPSTPTAAATSKSPSASVSPAAARPSQQEVLSAMTTVRQYLHAWVTEGPSRASRYLVASQRMRNDQGAPRISGGTVTSYRLYGWNGPRDFTLLVSMNLRFINNPMAWNRGVNERFVTAHRRGRDHGYRLEFASSP